MIYSLAILIITQSGPQVAQQQNWMLGFCIRDDPYQQLQLKAIKRKYIFIYY
jgi:hypothetical protein